MTPNFKQAIEMMFGFASKSAPKNESYYKKKDWFLKTEWTAKQQENFTDWLTDFLKKNWQGIVDSKPTTVNRKKAAEEFVFNYGFKTRKLTIKDFTPIVPDEQLRGIMSKEEYENFTKWMFGQTMSGYGVYRWDLEQWLAGGRSFD